MPARDGCKHAIKHDCTVLTASSAGAQRCTSFAVAESRTSALTVSNQREGLWGMGGGQGGSQGRESWAEGSPNPVPKLHREAFGCSCQLGSAGGTEPSRSIGAAETLVKVRGKVSPCSMTVRQQPQPSAGCSASQLACLFQHRLGSCCSSSRLVGNIHLICVLASTVHPFSFPGLEKE